MTHFIPSLLLAASDLLNPLEESPLPSRSTNTWFTSQMRDVLLVVGAALIMALVLFLWAFLTRKNRQRHSATSRGTRLIYRSEKGAVSSDGRRRRVRKKRREHPDNLPRNPTLAEAGGLPPLRPEDPSPPPSPNPPAVPPQTHAP
jgi:hypothetical protein